MSDNRDHWLDVDPSERTNEKYRFNYLMNKIIAGSAGTANYNDLSNRPKIESITLEGNKTASDLGLATKTELNTKQATLVDTGTGKNLSQIKVNDTTYSLLSGTDIEITTGGGGEGTTDYNELSNKPKINGFEIKGEVSLQDLGLKKAESIVAGSDDIVPFGVMESYVTKVINDLDGEEVGF